MIYSLRVLHCLSEKFIEINDENYYKEWIYSLESYFELCK